jgi:predicted ATPase/DNA-binding SARP family transcriptional activator
VRVGVLGPVAVTTDEGAIALPSPRERALLAVLSLHGGRVVDYDTLADAVFGDEAPARPLHALASLVSRVRKRVGTTVVATAPGGYRLDSTVVTVDADVFEQAVRSGVGLAEAMASWRGRPYAELDGWPPADAARVRLEELRHHGEEELAAALLRTEDPGAAVGELEALVATAPFRERRWVLLIRALYAAGRQADALGAFQRARTLLVDELGIEPGPELVAAERAVLAQERPASGSVPNSLPAPLTSFIGRGEVVDEITALLAGNRLVTLTGPGGVGKTRVAAALVDATSSKFPDGAGWADLSVLKPGGDAVRVMADAFGVGGEPGGSLLGALTRALEGRRVLLVADNCEHVLDGVVSAVEAILGADVDTVVLCTSREPLGIAAEQVVALPPLGFDGEDSPAVELLRRRIGTSGAETASELTALVDLAARLEGLPLALELAAARCRSLGVKDVARRLEGRFDLLADRHRSPRHRSLDAALSWSYELLRPDEQAVFQRLSVFAGAFGLDAAERVAGRGAATAVSVDDAIAGLVDKSLVLRSGDRFRFLDTTRTFAARLLAGSGNDTATRAHIAWMVDRVAEIRTGLRGPDEKLWVAVLDAEWPDVRAAVDRALEVDDADAVISLVVHLALEAMWRRPEALPWIEEAVRRYGDGAGPRRRELLGAGCLSAFSAGDIAEAVRRADVALAIDPEPGASVDVLPEAGAAGAYWFAGDYEPAVAACGRALDRAGALLELVDQALLFSSLALGTIPRSREEAASASARARDAALASQNPSQIAYTTAIYAFIHPRDAAAALDEASRMASEVRNRFAAALVAEVVARRQWSALRRGASADEANRAVSSFVALSRENYQAGWLTHARVVGRDLAALLFELARPDVAAAVLGGCDAFGTIPVPVNGPFPVALDELSRGGGSNELRRSYEFGRRAKFSDLLRLAEESSSPAPS